MSEVRKLIRDQLLPEGQADVCYGFKEIRYLKHLDELAPYLDFLAAVFPEPAFIFNTRDHEDVCNSGWWKNHDSKSLIKSLATADNLFTQYVDDHANAFLVKYEDVISAPDQLKALFRFLGAPFDEVQLRSVLKTAHGYGQKAETLEKARIRGAFDNDKHR